MSASKGCCEWLLNLFGRTPHSLSDNMNSVQPPHNSNLNFPHDYTRATNVMNNPEHLNNHISGNENSNLNLLPIINSKVKLEDITSSITPDKLKGIMYNCPICLKFYNHILVLSCCKNYLCFFCINSYIDTTRKYSTELKCLICNHLGSLILEDVDPKSQVKEF